MGRELISLSISAIALSGERRRRRRLYEPYPAQVRGVCRAGGDFLTETTVDNISSGGLYLRTPVEVDPRRAVHAVVYFKSVGNRGQGVPRLLIRGRVLRSEPQVDGRYGIAVEVKNYRFL